jgi:hypothetical protein
MKLAPSSGISPRHLNETACRYLKLQPIFLFRKPQKLLLFFIFYVSKYVGVMSQQ